MRTPSEIAASSVARVKESREQCLPIPLLDVIADVNEFMTAAAAVLVAAGLAPPATPS